MKFCETIGKSYDIWSVGHGQLSNYLLAIENVQVNETNILNPSNNLPIWLNLSSGIVKLEPGESISLKR